MRGVGVKRHLCQEMVLIIEFRSRVNVCNEKEIKIIAIGIDK